MVLVLGYISIPGVEAVMGWRVVEITDSDVAPEIYPHLPVAPDRVQTPRDRVKTNIIIAALRAGVDPEAAVRIASCESSLKPWIKNEESTASGLYQFTAGTWEHIRAPGSPFDEDEAIRQFMKWYPVAPHWWVCK